MWLGAAAAVDREKCGCEEEQETDAREHVMKVEADVQEIDGVHGQVDKNHFLLPSTGEWKVLHVKMKGGDCGEEFDTGDAKSKVADDVRVARASETKVLQDPDEERKMACVTKERLIGENIDVAVPQVVGETA